MAQTIKDIKKRDGRVVEFNASKITNAIFKALECVGQSDYGVAEALSQKVVDKLSQQLSDGEMPVVEQIQDIIEQVLLEQGKAKVAKAFIIYRQKRLEIRKQKEQILQKKRIDEIDKKFDLNSLRVLCSRYLRKDKSGKVIESPKQLFERVALHTTLPSIFFDSKIYQKDGLAEINVEEEFDLRQYADKLKIGRFILNEFHLDGLKRLYKRFNQKRQIKVKFSELIQLIQKGEFDSHSKEAERYFQLMANRKFFPNTPALANFGNFFGMGSACFVLPMEDSIEDIMDSLKSAAIIFRSGGGVGYNFSKLRPEGDRIKTTNGSSTGPISFMSLFDKMSDVIKQGGIRRGASMGILNSDHPDIENFIVAKKGNQGLRNFNISVFIKSDFWDYYNEGKPYPLRNPRNNKVVKYVDPRNLFDLIVYQAWESAEPGVIFDDHINKYNPFFETLGPLTCTNPCGELPLYPFGSCNLGSINVWSFCKITKDNNGKKVEFDWAGLEETIKTATRFLDNVIEINRFPLPEIEKVSLSARKIGLGMMGLADALYELGIPYNSPRGLSFMGEIMEFFTFHSKVVSVELAKERGKFPYYEKSFYPQGRLPFSGLEKKAGELNLDNKSKLNLDWEGLKQKIQQYGIRNAQTTTNAPTGSISMIAGCSSGIEPNFSLVYEKKVSIGSFYYVNPVFEKVMEREGLFDEDLIKGVSGAKGSINNLRYIPSRLKEIFVTSMDLSAEDHVRALAVLQRWTDSSISKTINFPHTASVDDMRKAYLLGHELGCKDLTVFRDQSIKGVLSAGKQMDKKEKSRNALKSLKDEKAKGPVIYQDVSAGGVPGLKDDLVEQNLCPNCSTELIMTEGCKKCPKCGWGMCTG